MKTLPNTRQQIIDYLNQLSPEDQERVLAFVRALSGEPQGIPGKELIEFFRRYTFTKEEADEMTLILEEMSK